MVERGIQKGKGVENAGDRDSRSTADVQLRNGAFRAECASRCEGSMQQYDACMYHRQSAHGQHHALRYVYLHGEPAGGGSHCRGTGRTDTHALRTDDSGALGAGKSDRTGRRKTSSESHVQMHV